MSAPLTCPRCSGPLRAPDLWSSEWRCERHGAVHPLHVAAKVTQEMLEQLVRQAAVPVWLPQPLLPGWTITGLGHAGDDRTGARAIAVACSGPSPIGGPADLLLVAEEPGVGLGARFAGLPGPDPGLTPNAAPDAKVEAAGHPTALWSVAAPEDRVAFVGEAKGLWLWAVLWPPTASLVLLEHVTLYDLHDPSPRDLVFGAPSPYLSPVTGG